MIFNIDPSGPWLILIGKARFWDADFGCFWPIDDLLRVSFRASSKTPCYSYILYEKQLRPARPGGPWLIPFSMLDFEPRLWPFLAYFWRFATRFLPGVFEDPVLLVPYAFSRFLSTK